MMEATWSMAWFSGRTRMTVPWAAPRSWAGQASTVTSRARNGLAAGRNSTWPGASPARLPAQAGVIRQLQSGWTAAPSQVAVTTVHSPAGMSPSRAVTRTLARSGEAARMAKRIKDTLLFMRSHQTWVRQEQGMNK
jgi:hypothetical protein